MTHIIFWMHILTIVLSAVSIFSSIVIYYSFKYNWQKYFAFVLFSLSLLLLNYTFFYFISLYLNKYIHILIKVYMFSIFSIISYIIYCIASFIKEIIEIKSIKIFYYILYSIFILMFFIFIPGLILWIKIIIFCGSMLYAFLLGIIMLIPVLYWKKIYNKKRIITAFFFIGIIFLPIELIEYFIRIKEFTNVSYLPLGLITFVMYCLIINILNLIFNLNILFKNKVYSTDNEISDIFLKKYSITNREKEIIELLIKGKSHKEIGWDLYISTRTVNRHVYNIYQKCKAYNLIDLINIIKSF